jgi:hypothetical protein
VLAASAGNDMLQALFSYLCASETATQRAAERQPDVADFKRIA